MGGWGSVPRVPSFRSGADRVTRIAASGGASTPPDPVKGYFFFWPGFLLPTFLFTAFYPNFAGFHEVLPSFTGFSLV